MSKVHLLGRQFGRLRVLQASMFGWACQCVCGVTTEVATDQLLGGARTSCGCDNPPLEIQQAYRRHPPIVSGTKFGRLQIEQPIHPGATVYWALCDCGERTRVDQENVKSGKTRSCGCLRDEMNRRNFLLRREAAQARMAAAKIHPV